MPVTTAVVDELLPARSSGTPLPVHTFTSAEINRKVDELLTVDLSNVRNCVLELLCQYVALTESTLHKCVSRQVAISENTGTFTRRLRKYRADGLLARVSRETIKSVKRAGLPTHQGTHLRAYKLGPVGEEYVKRKGWNGNVPLATVPESVLAHDLLCAEAMMRMGELWLSHPTSPGVAEVRGPREVLAWNPVEKRQTVAPDGMLIKRSMDGSTIERIFLVEYQNTRALLQVQTKIKKYIEIASEPEYRWVLSDVWGVSAMPIVLVIYRQGATLTDYQEEITSRGDMPVSFASTSLEEVWKGNLSIKAIK